MPCFYKKTSELCALVYIQTMLVEVYLLQYYAIFFFFLNVLQHFIIARAKKVLKSEH